MFIKKAKDVALSMTIAMVLISWFMPAGVYAKSVIPDNLVIMKIYRRGIGDSVGKIVSASGKAFIMHSDRKYGYVARQGLPVYEGDTLFTREGGRMIAVMNDNSRISLTSKSSIIVNKSIYDPAGKSRVSFMHMLAGKIRFIVTKLADYKYSRFNVRTKSSVVGVRGSDFIIQSMDGREKVTTLQHTLLAVSDINHPEAPPVMLRDFQQLDMIPGAPFGSPVDLPRDQVEDLLRDFAGNGGNGGHAGAPPEQPGKGESVGQGGGEQPVVDPALLEQPESVGGMEGNPVGNVVEGSLDTEATDSVNDVQDKVNTEVIQGEPGTLPDMPSQPSEHYHYYPE